MTNPEERLSHPEERLSAAIVEVVRKYDANSLNFNSVMRVLSRVHDELTDFGDGPASPSMDAELFRAVGRALFGDRWKSDMAGALGGIGVGTVDDWGKGRRQLPLRAWQELEPLLEERYTCIPALLAAVRAAGADEPVGQQEHGMSTITFREYLATRQITDTPAGDFTKDALADRDMPDVTAWEDLRSYLQRRASYEVRTAVIGAGREVWTAYQRKLKANSPAG